MKTKENTVEKAPFGVGEWAGDYRANFQTGCENGCKYCYAKAGLVNKKYVKVDDWEHPRIRMKDVMKDQTKDKDPVMFPTTHDLYPSNIVEYQMVLRKLLEVGNQVLVVSKPRLACTKTLCDSFVSRQSQILFRFTMGSVDNDTLRYWEPNAPSFEERLASLKYAFDAGYATSISVEPMLDTRIEELVNAVSPYVNNSIWLGRANSLVARVKTNNPGDTEVIERARALLKEQDDAYLVKLVEKWKTNPLIKFKDSVKRVAGIPRPKVKGLDV